MVKHYSITGRIFPIVQIEPASMEIRHNEIEAEMQRRGFNHNSPYEQPVRMAESVGKMVKGQETPSMLAGEQVRDIVLPPELQRYARSQDTQHPTKYFLTGAGQVTPRKPTSFGQEVEMGIPGLRKKVPMKAFQEYEP